MKKKIILGSAIIMLLIFTGCGNSSDSNTKSEVSNSNEESNTKK